MTGGDVLPEPTEGDLFKTRRVYRVGPYDSISIEVFGAPELSRELQADASGRISMPLVGVVEAGGKTTTEIATEVERRLSGSFVKNPQVTVNLKQTQSQVITVDGEVQQPGLYPVIGQMTLIRAIATAKGTTEDARQDDVVVFRTVAGQKMAAVYNLRAIRAGRYSDPEVFANDVIVVGEDGTRRLFRDVLTASPALITPLIYLLAQ